MDKSSLIDEVRIESNLIGRSNGMSRGSFARIKKRGAGFRSSDELITASDEGSCLQRTDIGESRRLGPREGSDPRHCVQRFPQSSANILTQIASNVE